MPDVEPRFIESHVPCTVVEHLNINSGVRNNTKKMLNMYASAVKEKKRKPKKRRLNNIRDDMKDYKMTEDMAIYRSVSHMNTKAGPLLPIGEKVRRIQDKGWSITTWRRPIGEKVRRIQDKGWSITTWRRPIGEKVRRIQDKGRSITTWRRPIGEKNSRQRLVHYYMEEAYR